MGRQVRGGQTRPPSKSISRAQAAEFMSRAVVICGKKLSRLQTLLEAKRREGHYFSGTGKTSVHASPRCDPARTGHR